jgi:Integrase zinc binding domain
MEEMSFPATKVKITISQNIIPGIKDKVTSTKHYTIIHTDGISIFYWKGNIVVSSDLFQEIFDGYHVNLNHPGQFSTYKTISAKFYTKNMEAQVRTYICQVCKKSKLSLPFPAPGVLVTLLTFFQQDSFGTPP